MRSKVFRLFALLVILTMVVSPVAAKDTDGRAPAASTGSASTTTGTASEEAVHAAADLPESPTGLYVVRLKDPSLSGYSGGIAGLAPTSTEATGTRKLDVTTAASQAYLSYLEAQQQEGIRSVEATLGRSVEVKFQYMNVLNAFAVALDHAEALKVAALPGVTVYPDAIRELDTDVGPLLIGAPAIWEGETASGLATQGEGIIIGVIDSGINSQHPSFAATDESGYTHINPYGPGVYKGWCAANPSFCNAKLVGAYNYNPVGQTPEDLDGHGSHTASTAGGNRHTASFNVGNDPYNILIQGVAPRANIIAFKVCNPSCPSSASVAAVNQGIADGVDVFNYSISGSDNPWNDLVDLAFLDAFNAGAYVSASAGNAGPGPSTVAKTGPWNAAVAASTHNRAIVQTLDVTAPTQPPALQGIAVVPGEGTNILTNIAGPLRYVASNNDGCVAFPPGSFTGALALIQRGGCTFAIKVQNAVAAGATGVVVFNSVGGPPITMGGLTGTPPAVMMDLNSGIALRDYVVANPTTTAVRINADTTIVYIDAWEDIVAGFSSRGPSQYEILKPDYIAPGVNILAAVAQESGAPIQYGFLQGTSMSSPHSAGAAALMIALNPTWGPAEIKSAITATTEGGLLKEDGLTAADPFDVGSGRVALELAAHAGLVFNETYANYVAANPAIGGDPKTLNQPSVVSKECAGSCSWTRTVKSVATTPHSYFAAITAPDGVVISVTPSTFTIAPGATQVLTISANVSAATPDVWAFGNITLNPLPARAVNTALLTEGFDNATFPPTGWTRVDVDGTGNQWVRATTTPQAGTGYAYHAYNTTPYQEGWLITPQISIPAGGAAELSFWQRDTYSLGNYYVYHGVLVTTDADPNPATATYVELWEGDIPTTWTNTVVDLSEYAGQTVYLAFKYAGLDADNWWIDTVEVSTEVTSTYSAIHVPVVVRPTISVPVMTLNPSSITSSQGPDTIVPKTLTIGNAGGASLIWNVFTDAPLLKPFGQATVVESSPAGQITIGDLSLAGSGLSGSFTPQFNPAPDSTTLTHSASQTITAGNSVACAATGTSNTAPNQYLRTFTLPNFGIVGDFDVSSVSFGIESATVAHTTTVNLYTLNGALNYANMTLIGTATASVSPQAGTILTVPVTANVPAGSTLVVEVAAPDLRPIPGGFFIGSNNLGQTAPSYLAAVDCGLSQPTDTAAIGFPGMHIVMNVTGTADAPTCDVPNSWASIAPTGGTVAPGASTNATVTFDSTGVAVGTYTANLCLESNDPALGLALVPLTMNVEEAAHISVSPEFFDFAIPLGGSDTGTLTISNLGVGDLIWSIAEEPGPESLLTWSDSFDSYATGSQLHGQGGWKGWFNDPTAGALASSAQAFSAPNSAAIVGASDLVHEYSGYTSGGWTYKTMMYVPSDFTGESYFILLNTYNDAGVGLNWSTQINFQAATNMVVNTGASGGNLPLIRGQWVELRIEIDLTSNTQSAFYNNQLLYSGSWSNEVSGGGAINIAAVDLFANGASVVYYDDISLEPSVYVPDVCEAPANVPWLSVSPTSGTTPGGDSDDVAVTASAAGLAAGAYSANLCVTSNDPANPLVVVPVDLEVLGEVPAIEVAPEMLDFTVMQGQSGSDTLVISNVGSADLLWEVGEEAPATRMATELLHDNGPFVTNPGAGPGGSDHSVLQNQTLGMITLGFGVQQSAGNRMADDFTVTHPNGWDVSQFRFYAYQTNSGTTSTITGLNYRIWDGPPNLPTSNIIFGDTTTNRLVSTNWSSAYRVSQATVDTARPIMNVDASGGFHLPAGTYWVDWQFAGSLASGPWQPPITITGVTVTGNAIQFASGAWAPANDTGTTPYQQGMPFLIHGVIADDPVCSTLGDVEWLSAAPASGTTPAGESDDVTVTADATGLELGSYSANLCVASNDPLNPLVVVPVSLEVIEYVGWAPQAGFTFDYPVYEGVPVHFTNTTTGEGPITYAWDFGDGGTSTAENPTYTFAAAGAYTVTLTATNMWGDGVYEELVVVAPPLPGHADLSVAITVEPTPVQVGVETTFTAVVTNHGPDPVSGVYVSGDLPENVEFISGVNCSLDEGVLSCNLGTIGVNESKTAVVVLKFTAAGSFEISLGAIGDLDDPEPGNNAGTVTIEVTQPAVQEYWIYAPIIRRGQ